MKVPPACTYRSRSANEVASSVAVPKCIAPRLSTLTSRRVLGSVPIVRYFIQGSLQPLGPSERRVQVWLLERAPGQAASAGRDSSGVPHDGAGAEDGTRDFAAGF